MPQSVTLDSNVRNKVSFGQLLLERGLVTKEKLLAARQEQTVTQERIGKILVRNGFLRQDDLFKLLREVNPNALHDETVFQSIVPHSLLIDTRSMITAMVENTVIISTLSPRGKVLALLQPYLVDYKVEFTGANPIRIEDYLSKLKHSGNAKVQTWEKIFHDAMRTNASDIHILPRRRTYTVMIRVDGVQRFLHEGTLDEFNILSSRVKDLAKMDMAERRKPQDGSFVMDFSGRVIEFRVATVITVDGEKIVVRIMDPDNNNRNLEELGITRLAQWREAVGKPNGLCLICGPTGSGKTTTLSSTVREMNFLERAVYSAEDPVETRIPYAAQVPINPSVGLDFAAAIKNFMRADPDVILVGEIRDIETARNATKAGETGHLVLATMHTRSIQGTFARLRDIGVPPQELFFLLRGVMVQGLMRMTCKHCHGDGCQICNHTGYKGREVISESASFSSPEEVEAAYEGKICWPTLADDAYLKVKSGKTTPEEFYRVTGLVFEAYQPGEYI